MNIFNNSLKIEIAFIGILSIFVFLISHNKKNKKIFTDLILTILGIYVGEFIIYSIFGNRIELYAKIIILIITTLSSIVINKIKKNKNEN